MERRIFPQILEDLSTKMVFISGPRQTGKTTLAQTIQEKIGGTYYNWDNDEDRKKVRNNKLEDSSPLWIFDEIHKNKKWRNWIKGIYDKKKNEKKILVTGSARLDLYRFGGDSLQGRYFAHRMHPLTFSEIAGIKTYDYSKIPQISIHYPKNGAEIIANLMRFGGFPEPFLGANEKKSKRWRLAYASRIIKDDIRDLENIQNLTAMELLLDRLPETVGSVLSMNSLREDIEVSFPTIKNWINIFEKTYTVFRILPFGPAKIKAVKKEPKLYFWDWSRIEDQGARYENMMAVHLLRFVHWMEDVEGEKYELRYIRNTLDYEVDFLLLKNGTPWIAIEAKLQERPLDRGIKYFCERLNIPHAFQVCMEGDNFFQFQTSEKTKIFSIPAIRFLAQLP